MSCLLSVLIPVYNAADNLNKLFTSIISQWNNEIEVVALNDGSKDNSLEILNEFHRAYPEQIKVITRENKGALLTRRELFAASSGEWVWVIDSDDEIANDAVVFLLNQIKGTNTDMIMFDYFQKNGTNIRTIYQLNAKDGEIFSGDKKTLLYREVIRGDRINNLWSKVFRRSCIDDADYTKFKNVRMTNDKIQLLPILTNANMIVYFRKPLYKYNVIIGSLCHGYKDYMVESNFTVCTEIDRYIDIWGKRNEFDHAFKYYVSDIAIGIVEKYIFEVSDKAKDVKSLFDRILCYPIVRNGFSVIKPKEMPAKKRTIFICLREGNFKRAIRLIKIKNLLANIHSLIYVCRVEARRVVRMKRELGLPNE